jgi:hypothetical protein
MKQFGYIKGVIMKQFGYIDQSPSSPEPADKGVLRQDAPTGTD